MMNVAYTGYFSFELWQPTSFVANSIDWTMMQLPIPRNTSFLCLSYVFDTAWFVLMHLTVFCHLCALACLLLHLFSPFFDVSFYVHTEHFVFGFILVPTGHWNTELNRGEFMARPSTLKKKELLSVKIYSKWSNHLPFWIGWVLIQLEGEDVRNWTQVGAVGL